MADCKVARRQTVAFGETVDVGRRGVADDRIRFFVLHHDDKDVREVW